jgi:Uma2 family endonuclease
MGSSAPILELFPGPGEWTEEDYFELSDRGRLVELSEGNIEVLPLPTELHQLILMRLSAALFLFATENRLGAVRVAPLPVCLGPGKFREPDLIFMSAAHKDRIGKYWGVPDLAVEILSESNALHDRKIKRAEYELAGVLEYWIVDPEAQTVEVIRFGKETRLLAGNDALTSTLFPGWSYSLGKLFEANT